VLSPVSLHPGRGLNVFVGDALWCFNAAALQPDHATCGASATEKGKAMAQPPTVSPFAMQVADLVRAIPRGQTLSYGMVAALAGRPGGARAVVRALRMVDDLPWWRVVRAAHTLAAEVAQEQARHLRQEGVTVSGRRVVPTQVESASRRAMSRRRTTKRA
jgi:methylated-DNA-protein-cysteine methyltransferase-like protein